MRVSLIVNSIFIHSTLSARVTQHTDVQAHCCGLKVGSAFTYKSSTKNKWFSGGEVKECGSDSVHGTTPTSGTTRQEYKCDKVRTSLLETGKATSTGINSAGETCYCTCEGCGGYPPSSCRDLEPMDDDDCDCCASSLAQYGAELKEEEQAIDSDDWIPEACRGCDMMNSRSSKGGFYFVCASGICDYQCKCASLAEVFSKLEQEDEVEGCCGLRVGSSFRYFSSTKRDWYSGGTVTTCGGNSVHGTTPTSGSIRQQYNCDKVKPALLLETEEVQFEDGEKAEVLQAETFVAGKAGSNSSCHSYQPAACQQMCGGKWCLTDDVSCCEGIYGYAPCQRTLRSGGYC